MRTTIAILIILSGCQVDKEKSLPTCDNCKTLTLQTYVKDVLVHSVYKLRPFTPIDTIRFLNFDSLTTSKNFEGQLNYIWNSSPIKIFTNSSRRIGKLLFLKVLNQNVSSTLVGFYLVTNKDALVPLYKFRLTNNSDNVEINENPLFPDKYISLKEWDTLDSIRRANPLPE